jgi:polar amino acid transport system permease protein
VRGAQIEVAKFANFTPYVVAGLLFVLLAIPTVRLADRIQRNYSEREQAGNAL